MLRIWLTLMTSFAVSLSANAAEVTTSEESVNNAAVTQSADSEEVANEKSFVKNLADTFINDIFESKKSEQEKVDVFKDIFLKNCDINFISKFVLGKAWKTASAEEKDSFTTAFSDAVVLTWAGRFKEYNGQKIEVLTIRPANSGQSYVDSSVINPDNPNDKPISLIWRIENKDGQYKIVDLIVEGVSMAMTYRNEYLAVLQAKGGKITALTENLQEKNKKLASDLKVVLE